jgi:hypothetical protein
VFEITSQQSLRDTRQLGNSIPGTSIIPYRMRNLIDKECDSISSILELLCLTSMHKEVSYSTDVVFVSAHHSQAWEVVAGSFKISILPLQNPHSHDFFSM